MGASASASAQGGDYNNGDVKTTPESASVPGGALKGIEKEKKREKKKHEMKVNEETKAEEKTSDVDIDSGIDGGGQSKDPIFETFVHSNGDEYTTIMDKDGIRKYMDWDTGLWLAFPDEWKDEGHFENEEVADVGESGSSGSCTIDGYVGNRGGTYTHSSGRIFTTYVFEVRRNIRYFFDEYSCSWVRMPVNWEKDLDDVKLLLQEVKSLAPDWNDDEHILEVLRDNNYDINDAINAKVALDMTIKKCGQYKRGSGFFSGAQFGNKERHADTLEIGIDELNLMRAQITSLEEELMRKNMELLELAGSKKSKDDSKLKKKLKSVNKKCEAAESELSTSKEHIKELEAKLADIQNEVKGLQSSGDDKFQNALAEKEEATKEMETNIKSLKKKLKKAEMSSKISTDTAKGLKNAHISITELHKTTIKLREDTVAIFASFAPMFKKYYEDAKNLTASENGLRQELTLIKSQYRAEALQRKLLFNKIQEIQGNIRVYCRCRKDDSGPCVIKFDEGTGVLNYQYPNDRQRQFEFDKMFTTSASQSDVFSNTKDTIMSCMDGYNVCIMAYGQTGSGKTHTMMGYEGEPGVNKRALDELFSLSVQRKEFTYNVSVQFLEIYNEKLFDLLGSSEKQNLDVKRGPHGFHVPGLTDVTVSNTDGVLAALEKGMANRSVAATAMNAHSSRSHSILMVNVHAVNNLSGEETFGKLTLVDLAGSERVGRSEATGQRLVEAAAINKSLSALGQVFTALRLNSVHVPYRNSKLTYLLQDSLGGDSKTIVFLAISPLVENLEETSSSLTFGQGIRQVMLGKATANKKGGPSKK